MSIQTIDGSNIMPTNAHTKELKEVIENSDQWREISEKLAEWLRLRGILSGLFAAEEEDLAEFDRMKEASK